MVQQRGAMQIREDREVDGKGFQLKAKRAPKRGSGE